ncbi:MAG TPA: hypothetical protein VL282_02570, partial [Tepidisphaeraceae bacterium]|nr:hypothetical protein [Tepidisphaeraceae bacterium]
IVALLLLVATNSFAANKVAFNNEGICLVNGKPFFPIGIFVYNLNSDVMADLHEHRFNTICGVGYTAADLKLIEDHGMYVIPRPTDDFLALKDSPSLLAWYLEDEPEEHNVAPADVKKKYDALKAKDKDHPISVVHDMMIGPKNYKGCSDVTITDVYPVTKNRDFPMRAVGHYEDVAREVNGPNWPNFVFVQTFGGPNSDGGKWAQPLPHEVRFMAFSALVHRANGILYFSYWPQAQTTWASIAQLNKDIQHLVPWLTSPGEEIKATSSDENVQVRARQLGDSWMIIATNISARPIEATISLPRLAGVRFMMPFENRTVPAKDGTWHERFDAYAEHTYLLGDEPNPR